MATIITAPAKGAPNSNAANNNTTNDLITQHDSKIRPFEWLTSSQSLQPIIESLEQLPSERTALHVGCGSSIVGEWLVEELDFSRVVNIDCDREILDRMERRWKNKQGAADCDDDRVTFQCVDFVDRAAALRIPSSQPNEHTDQDISNSTTANADQKFDLILDKSTLDCTLCSEDASTGLLRLVYRHLAVGGYYVVISFHHLNLLLPLLQDLPGANWQTRVTIMPRQIEDLIGSSTPQVLDEGKASTVPDTMLSTRTVNVVICQKQNGDDLLDWDLVQKHIHATNNAWYQTLNPLLSEERRLQLERDFSVPPKAVDDTSATSVKSSSSQSLRRLTVPKCYTVLFTDAEREHLTYDNFLEDWRAYIVGQQEQRTTSGSRDHTTEDEETMSLATALDFLQEMQ
jgi:hypothetical protein